MPLLSALVAGVYRDLADEATPHVFSTLQIEDFIRGGIADLNRVAPSDITHDIELVVDVDSGLVTSYAYDIPIEHPYRTEIVRTDGIVVLNLSEPVDGWVGSGGMDFKRTSSGGRMSFPAWWLTPFDSENLIIRVHGYASRPLPYNDGSDPAVDLSDEEEYSVRAYAKSAGYDLLSHDRSIYAQWIGQTNNTDVSPTQMMQMAAGAKQEWDRHRGLIRTVRLYQ